MSEHEAFTLWRDGLPSWLHREHVVLAPGEVRQDVHHDWLDALVVVEYGSVVLTGAQGRTVRLQQGAVLSVGGLCSATVRNEQATTAMLAVGRRRSRGS